MKIRWDEKSDKAMKSASLSKKKLNPTVTSLVIWWWWTIHWFHNSFASEAGCSISKVRSCCPTLHPHTSLLCFPLHCAPACLTHYSPQSQGKAVLGQLWFWNEGDVALTEAVYNLFLICSCSWVLTYFSYKSWLVDFIIASEFLYDNKRLCRRSL